jgi:hypothetical protein
MAITTQTDVANYALTKINVGTIEDIDSTTDNASVLCKLFYDDALEYCLREDEWVFAIIREDSLVSATAGNGYDYAYSLPADCILPLDFEDGGEFMKEGIVIYTDVENPTLRYVFKNTNPAQWTPEFRELVALRLAQLVAYRLTQDASRATMVYQEYMARLPYAKNLNGLERNEKDPEDPPEEWDR